MNTVWWYVLEGDRKGPVSEEDLHRLLAAGKISANSLVWKAGMEGWQSVAQVKDLTPMLASLPPEVPLAQKTPQRTIAAPGAWHRVRRHSGSTVALLLGCLSVISGIVNVASVPTSTTSAPKGGVLIAGLVMILGALAYRSAKKRKLGEAKSTLTRQAIEAALLLLICLLILAQNNLKHLIITDPVPNLIIPLWAILAYLVIALGPRRLVGDH